MNLTWSDFGTMSVVASAVVGVLFWALRGRLMNDFVSKSEHDEDMKHIAERLGTIEQRMQLVPSHEDFRTIVSKVADVARDVAVVNAHTQGLKESMNRIERELNLFARARLDWEKNQ